jgi:hypothetical protein
VEVAAYLLCTATALACTILLWRGYRRSKVRLLLWSALCFLAMTVENAVLFIDKVITGPDVDLSLVRLAAGLAGIVVLLFGLVWEDR